MTPRTGSVPHCMIDGLWFSILLNSVTLELNEVFIDLVCSREERNGGKSAWDSIAVE